jgi:flagellar basal body-associated protein FliL
MIHALFRIMSEAVAEKAAAPAAPGGNKKLVIILIAFNVLLAGGLGYFALVGRAQPAEKSKHAAKAAAEGGEDAKEGAEPAEEEAPEAEGKNKKAKFGPLIDVGSFVANLANAGSGPGRYAKVTVNVEAINEDAKTSVEAAQVPIRSEALLLFSNAKPEDLVGQDKVLALGDELVKRVNKLLGKKTIRHVFFSELVVQ